MRISERCESFDDPVTALPVSVRNPDFDEFVIVECFVDLSEQGLGHAAGADIENRT